MKVKDFEPGEAFVWRASATGATGIYLAIKSHKRDYTCLVLKSCGISLQWTITHFNGDEEVEPYENP